MKYGWLYLISLLATNVASADDFGICNYGKQRVPSVICFGPAILKDTVVGGNIKVVGPLTAHNVQAKSMSVTGSAEVYDTQIASEVTVTGYLQAYRSHFYSTMVIDNDTVLLDHTIVGGDITVNSSVSKPVVTIQCGSSVNGNVTFGGVAGVVQVSDNSAMQGKVNNGVLEYIRPQCN